MRPLIIALVLSLAAGSALAQTTPPPPDGGHECESKKDDKPTA